MGDDIAQPGDLAPRDSRSLVTLELRNVLCRFADDLKVTDDGINAHLVGLEGGKINLDGVPFDPGDRLQNILQVQAIVSRHR